MVDKEKIIREFREKINNPLMQLGRWQDFLEGDYWKPEFSDGSGSGFCLICGQKVSGAYVGSHFSQTHTKQEEHQQVCKRYSDVLKKVFENILDDYGYKLKPCDDDIWWQARISPSWAYWSWNKCVEKK